MDPALYKVTGKSVFVTGIAVLLSWILHEFAHWTAGTLLGYEMGMSLNKTFSLSGGFKNNGDYQLISAAGPAFTILEAFVVYWLIRYRKLVVLYPFLLTCFYMRFFAAVISIRRPNDEAKISAYFSLGTFTLPIIVTAILLLLVYKTSRNNNLSLRFNMLTLGLIIFFSSIIILSDQFLHVRLL